MNAQLSSQLLAATRILQSQVGETVTLGGVDYPCTASDLVTSHLDFEQGGALQIISVTVCVAQADLSTAPLVDTLAVFRGSNLRVISVDDAVTFWSVMLVQEFA